MAKHWEYTQTPNQVGLMVCTACQRNITEGQFRYRETDDAYLPQHRACSADDPKWAQLDSAAAAWAATVKIIGNLETLASELSEGQEPSKPALLEAVRRALHPLT